MPWNRPRNVRRRAKVGLCMTLGACLLSALVVVAALPPSASAAAVADRVIDEVSAPMDVGIDGNVIAYTRRVGSKITGRLPLAGVAVEVRDSGGKLVASLTTDAQG